MPPAMNILERIFPGESEAAKIMRDYDWSKNSLGPVEHWPQNLQIALGICLTSKFPMNVWWGKDLILFYNDAYISFLGPHKHPAVLGQSGRQAWQEIWSTIGPMIAEVLSTGVASWSEDILMFFDRQLPQEEVYVTFSFSPVLGMDGQVEGLFCACSEATEKLVSNRRLETLRKLSQRPSAQPSMSRSCSHIQKVLLGNPSDIPFAAMYAVDEEHQAARLLCEVRTEAAHALPEEVLFKEPECGPWPLAAFQRDKGQEQVLDLRQIAPHISGGPWHDPLFQALILDIPDFTSDRSAGFLVIGISPRRVWDEQYRSFFMLIAGQIGKMFGDARACEVEQRRLQALLDLDRAKTTFFNNVSHEFRTPLSLILAPLEDALAKLDMGHITGIDHCMRTAHGNARRLLKLVNTLLDFSRIEAKRVQAYFEPTDLATLTTELASSFRSLTDRAGLRLEVHCEKLLEPVYVDREMWEKIVLNLLSNAFKFTWEGGITVILKSRKEGIELLIRDTGIGIAPEHIPQLFERFYRIEGVKSRSYEGSGIGLALVRELVQMHAGRIEVQSRKDHGTQFSIKLRLGRKHLPADRVRMAPDSEEAGLASAFVQEANRWLPVDEPEVWSHDEGVKASTQRILLVEDNIDMREYLFRMLSRVWQVEVAADGDVALRFLQSQSYDLVLSDVMMPVMDGIALIKALRSDPRLQTIPVILLSARAGEDRRIEALQTGADDYLIKPFSAREVMARIRATLKISELRVAAYEERAANLAKSAFLANMSHEVRTPLGVIKGFTEMLLAEELGEEERTKFLQTILRNVDLLAHVIDDILDLSKIEAGKMSVEILDVPLAAFISDIQCTLTTQAMKKGLALRINAGESLPVIRTDPTRLKQILINIIGNAIKFTAAGEIEVRIEVQMNAVQFTVRDTGLGMNADQQAKLFQAFTQADVSMTRKFGGTGLGLLLSKRLAQALGGDVSLLESREGQGTTFLIRIMAEIVQPAEVPDAVETACPAARPKKLLEGICVLLADDGADMQALIGHILRRQGAQVEIAENGQEAVERAMAKRFDVVLMDLQMPVCDGFQATLELRRRGYEGPVIAVSAAAMMLEKERSLGVGCDEHISKPVNVQDLVDKVVRYARPRFLHSAKKRGGRFFDRNLFN